MTTLLITAATIGKRFLPFCDKEICFALFDLFFVVLDNDSWSVPVSSRSLVEMHVGFRINF